MKFGIIDIPILEKERLVFNAIIDAHGDAATGKNSICILFKKVLYFKIIL